MKGFYTEHHAFVPLSPKLLVIFRSFDFPCGIDDGGTEDMHAHPESAGSILEDSPVKKCGNSYTGVINGNVFSNSGRREPGS